MKVTRKDIATVLYLRDFSGERKKPLLYEGGGILLCPRKLALTHSKRTVRRTDKKRNRNVDRKKLRQKYNRLQLETDAKKE